MNKLLLRSKLPTIHFFALAALGKGFSGGDRIFIEFARHWSKKVIVKIYVWEEGLLMCQRENLKGPNLDFKLVKVGIFSKLGFVFTYAYRIFLGLKLGLTLRIQDKDYIYSASEFWMDSLPAFLLKIRYQKIKWIAAWFQTAPNPLMGFSEGKRKRLYRLNALLYWFMQQPVKPLISKYADFILVNNTLEKKQFSQISKENKVLVVKGAVNTEIISKYINTHRPSKDKKYLAVFQGRFHPQKGVVELIDIWKLVTQRVPSAILAMIGDGPLMTNVKKRIEELDLKNNIKLFGYLHDGDRKYSIFQNSKIVVHPAFYDSGGMAAAEAMAFGLPCVGFDLKSYLSYYPEGMLKVPVGEITSFSEIIIRLSDDKNQYRRLSKKARNMVLADFSWDTRAREMLHSLRIINES